MNAAAPRLINRRNALRMALAVLPAVVGGTVAVTNAAAAPTAVQTQNGTIELIDAVSQTLSDPGAARRALVAGTYCPSASTTGPIPGTQLRRIDGDVVASADGQVIENLEVFGSINLRSFTGVTIRNCVVWGTMATGTDTAFIIFGSENGRSAVIEDCRLNGRGNVWCSGVRGGNYTMRRTEITNASDGVSLTSQIGNVTVEACWIHNGYYMEWSADTPNMPKQGGNYTHVDGVQFHRGKNYTFRGNMIGGTRCPAKYQTGALAQIQAADDMYNSAFMIKQEVDNTAANKIENVLIESNWLAGGGATINIASGRDNTFSSLIIRNNRFVRSTWGPQMYILTPPGYGTLSNNVFDDDNQGVPISKGV